VAIDPVNGTVFVTDSNGGQNGNLSVIQGTMYVSSVPVGSVPDAVTLDTSDADLYVSNDGSNSVSVIHGSSVVGTISTYGFPNPAVIDPANGYVYIANSNDRLGEVEIVNGTTPVATIPLAGHTYDPSFDAADGYVYVPFEDEGATQPGYHANVSIINGTSGLASVSIGRWPTGSVFDAYNGFLYVPEGGLYSGIPSNVSVLQGQSVIATVPSVHLPRAATVDPVDGYLYVSSLDSDDVTVINGTSAIASLVVGSDPGAGAFDPINGCAYVLNQGSNNVSVIRGTAVIRSIPVGADPVAAAFDPTNGYIYVLNSGSNNVSVINGSFVYPTISSFVASPPTLEIGSPTLSSTTLLVTAGYGIGTLTFSYSGLPAGCASSNTPNLLCTPDLPGRSDVRVDVSDSAGDVSAATTDLTVIAPLAASPMAIPNPADAHTPVEFLANASAGIGPNAVEWSFGDGSWSNSPNASHSFSVGGAYNVRLWVNDSGGASVLRTLAMSVNPALTASVHASSTTPELGEALSIQVLASGGGGHYVYSYLGLPPGCASEDEPELTCVPSQVGSFHILITVQDRLGVNWTGNLTETVVRTSPGPWASWYVPVGIAAGVAAAGLVAAVIVHRRKRKFSSEPNPPHAKEGAR
jgi:YVTN family beta-propeller protein